MTEPALTLAGAETATDMSEVVTLGMKTGKDGADSGLVPAELVACTLKV